MEQAKKIKTKKNRCRLDALLLSRGIASTLALAQSVILSGKVLVNEQKITKVGTSVSVDATLRLLDPPAPYVSRGGIKLAHALTTFGLEVKDRIALDVGASTGGFTDCLLQRGARKVYAIDVGYGQLDWKLQTDSRVVMRDRVNIRTLTAEMLYGATTPGRPRGAAPTGNGDHELLVRTDDPATLAVIDVSFIHLRAVLPAVCALLNPAMPGDIVALVKPQFEARKDQVEAGGIVRDPSVHQDVLTRACQEAEGLGLRVAGTTESPIHGADGNKEFLVWLVRN
jgi:23S rRNA (cytidine1920-2'-O)/16S rRNA (cytidine1409-2'-O)-methyltransferase